MPVHEIRYQTWQGDLAPGWVRLLAIPRFSLMAAFNKWIALALFSGCIQLVAYTGYLLLVTNPLIREVLNINVPIELLSTARIFRNFFIVQFVICLILAVMAGPKLISPERQHNALPMIYSRPINRTSYIFGKFLSVGLLLSALTWVQAIVLFIIMMAIYPSGHVFWRDFWFSQDGNTLASFPLLLKAVLYGMLLTVALGSFVLACSSATKNFVHAAILYFVILFGTTFISFFIQENIYSKFPDIGLRGIFDSLGFLFFTLDPPSVISPVALVIMLIVWIGGSYLFMRWRLRPVDVYKE